MTIINKLAAIAAGISLNVLAQNQNPTPIAAPAAPARLTPPTNGPARPIQRPDRVMQDLALTEEQRNQLQEANKTFGTNAAPIYSRLTTARRELDALANQDKLDESSIRSKAKEIADLEADLAIARARRFAKLRSFLTPEQARRLNQMPPLARSFQPALHDGQAPPSVSSAK
jgi:Spy/CpxP family protein refolding chaperone